MSFGKPILFKSLMWGEGDAEGLEVFVRPYAFATKVTQVHIAAWSQIHTRHGQFWGMASLLADS